MIERIIDLSEEPARLHVRNSLLVIEREGQSEVTVPLAEIAVLVVSHPRISFTHAVLSGIAAAGGSFIVCDEKRLPIGMLLPLQAHYVQSLRFQRQAAASLPLRKVLWKQIVRAKVRAQARLLMQLRGCDFGLLQLAKQVRSGDTTNIESQASRRYWPQVFADPTFVRGSDKQDQNILLNYGYSVLRAIVARAICAAGLHPSLGLHHHNQYDCFCLADDLMEPFRPIVDEAVAHWCAQHGPNPTLDSQTKQFLLNALMGKFMMDGEARTLFDIVSRTASSLNDVFAGQRRRLLLPD